jgi:ABC-type glycerol-3-phosphate transport system substrate-binding protein
VKKLHLLLMPAAVLALVFGLVACGGSDESDEDKVVETVETAATSNDPAVCDETQTLAFIEQTTGSNGKEAEKQCEKEAEGGESQPDSVEVSEVEVDGQSATANAKFKGGNLDAQTLEIGLIEEDGDWKLDELIGFAEFDSESLVKAITEQIENEPGADPETASCFVEGVEGLSDSELEGVVIDNNTAVFGEIAEGCE